MTAHRAADQPAPTGRTWLLIALAAVAALAAATYLPTLGDGYYYDDGLLLRLGVDARHAPAETIFSTGFNGHVRPLPIAVAAGVAAMGGLKDPLALRLVSLAVHAANTAMLLLVLYRLLGPRRRLVALLAAGLFAVHWRASEAVTYVAASGVAWAVFGGLVACLGATVRTRSAWPAVLLLTVGLAIAFAGGEYGVAMLPPVLVAIWLSYRGPDHATARRAGLTAATLTLTLAYVAMSVRRTGDGRIGSEYSLGAHVAVNLWENLAAIFFPTSIVDEWAGVLMVVILAIVFAIACRRRPRHEKILLWGLLAAAIGALVPFAPSRAGNFARFLYPAAGFFAAWLMLGAWMLLDRPKGSRVAVRLGTISIAAALALVYVAEGASRQAVERGRGQELRKLLGRVERTCRDHPGQAVHLYLVNHQSEHAPDVIRALELLPPGQIHRGRPEKAVPPAGEIWLLARYDLRGGFAIHQAGQADGENVTARNAP